MPPRISKEKQQKIIQLYLEGVTVVKIGKKVKASTAQVSIEVKRFKTLSDESLERAARVYNVSETVGEIRSLSMEMRNLKLTADDCNEVVRYIRKMEELGISLEQLKPFVNMIVRLQKAKISLDEYIEYGLKLEALEKETGLSYKEILKAAQKEVAQLQKAREQLKIVRQQISTERLSLTKLNTDRERRIRNAKLDNEKIEIAIAIDRLLKKLRISSGDLKNFMSDIKELNLDLKTLLKLLREFKR
ncbi:MAG: hypothetical protein V3U49_05635 [Nitrososphaerales archaeon]